MNELTRLPASVLREEIAAKRISPVELTDAVLARAEKLQPVLNCFITIAADQAGKILPWALVSATVSMALRAVEQRAGFLGRIAVALIGVAWAAEQTITTRQEHREVVTRLLSNAMFGFAAQSPTVKNNPHRKDASSMASTASADNPE